MPITPTPDPDGEFQYIPVPKEHVRPVLAFLGERISAAAFPATTPAESVAEDISAAGQEAPDGWTDEDLSRFFALGTKTSTTVEQMLRHLSGQPGRDGALSTRELAEALNVKYSLMKMLPTQVARTLNKHFPQLPKPWRAQSGPRFTPPRANEVFFWVTPERAAQLERLQG